MAFAPLTLMQLYYTYVDKSLCVNSMQYIFPWPKPVSEIVYVFEMSRSSSLRHKLCTSGSVGWVGVV